MDHADEWDEVRKLRLYFNLHNKFHNTLFVVGYNIKEPFVLAKFHLHKFYMQSVWSLEAPWKSNVSSCQYLSVYYIYWYWKRFSLYLSFLQNFINCGDVTIAYTKTFYLLTLANAYDNKKKKTYYIIVLHSICLEYQIYILSIVWLCVHSSQGELLSNFSLSVKKNILLGKTLKAYLY